VLGDSSPTKGERIVWSRGRRAERYREQAGRFKQLADEEVQPRARERLLDLASQYLELAHEVSGRNTQEASGRLPATRDRNR
jgi:hypothetical protein